MHGHPSRKVQPDAVEYFPFAKMENANHNPAFTLSIENTRRFLSSCGRLPERLLLRS